MRLIGRLAIAFAEVNGDNLGYCPAGEPTREDLRPDEARLIAERDPSLIYLDVSDPIGTHTGCGGDIVSDADCIPGGDGGDELYWNYRCTKCRTVFREVREF